MTMDWRRLCALCALVMGVACGDDSDPGRVAADGGTERDDADGGEEPGSDDAGKAGSGGKGGPAQGGAGGQGGKGGAGGAPSKPAEPGTAENVRFFLPTGEPTNTTAPTLLADAEGGTHMLYPTYGSGGAFYAYCGSKCTGLDDVKPVKLATEGTVGNVALALTRSGKPRALLSTYLRVYYATCDDACTESESWTVTPILEHEGNQDVTGRALALDPDDHPRFIVHAPIAFLGVGQVPPKTWYASCDADCGNASSWQQQEIAEDKIWFGSDLQIDQAGRAHVLTGVENADGMSAGIKLAAYLECDADCETSAEAWVGIGLSPLYESHTEDMHQTLSLALTQKGLPRLLMLDRGGPNGRRLVYFECDADCREDNWTGSVLSDLKELGTGVDMVMDAQDHPSFVFTLDDNIGLYRCTSPSCAADDADWKLTKVEMSTDLPKDNIILWPNCSVDVWVLHTPSLALAPGGAVRVGYEATDLSGGVKVIDPNMPSCVAGKDMTLSRMTLVAAGAQL